MGEEYTTGSTSSNIVMLIFLALLLSLILKQISSRYQVAYSPLLLLIGLGLGGLYSAYKSGMGNLGDAINTWNHIHPGTVLLIFIPPLIFEASYNSDWHIFRKQIWQITLLSILGVIISAPLIAVCFKYLCGYNNDITFNEALVFGAILSPTDPVSVLAMFRDLGGSKELASLIKGESIFNDGSAILLFTIVIDFAKNTHTGFWLTLGEFLRVGVGGVAFGLIAAFVIAFWLKRMFNVPILVISLTLSTSYLIYYTACLPILSVSGLIAVSVYGLYMSNMGKVKLNPSAEQVVNEFWGMASFVAESIIFVGVGIVVATSINETWQQSHLTADIFKLFLLYVMIHIIRFIMLLLLWPLLYNSGYGLTLRELFFLCFGGVKGAVSLTLALFINLDKEFGSENRMTELILFHTAGLVLLTILVNGNLAGYVYKWLGIKEEQGAVQGELVGNAIEGYIRATRKIIIELKKNNNYALADWKTVKKIIRLGEVKDYMWKMRGGTEDHLGPAIQEALLNHSDKLVELRNRLLNNLKGIYWRYFEEGIVSGNILLILKEGVEESLDKDRESISDWAYIEHYITHAPYYKIIRCLSRLPSSFGNFFRKILFHHIISYYEIALIFNQAHKEAEVLLKSPHNSDIENVIKRESRLNRRKAQALLEEISTHFPEISTSLQNHRAAYYILVNQRDYLEKAFQIGQLKDKQTRVLLGKVESRLYRLHLKSPSYVQPNSHDWLCQFGLLRRIFSEAEMKNILLQRTDKTYSKGDYIYREGEVISSVFAVVRGFAIENCSLDKLETNNGNYWKKGLNPDFMTEYSMGEVVGLFYAIFNPGIYVTHAVVSTPMAQIVAFPITLITEMFNRKKERTLCRIFASIIIKLYGFNFPQLFYCPESLIRQLLNESSLKILLQDDAIESTYGLLILQGEIAPSERYSVLLRKSEDEEEEVKDTSEAEERIPHLVIPKSTLYLAKERTILFVPPEYLMEKWDEENSLKEELMRQTANKKYFKGISAVGMEHSERTSSKGSFIDTQRLDDYPLHLSDLEAP